MLVHRLLRWPNIRPTSGQRLVFAGMSLLRYIIMIINQKKMRKQCFDIISRISIHANTRCVTMVTYNKHPRVFLSYVHLVLCNVAVTQQTENICITFIQRRPNVFDVGRALYKCYTNVLCLLGSQLT